MIASGPYVDRILFISLATRSRASFQLILT
jgi:hypothetical protein